MEPQIYMDDGKRKKYTNRIQEFVTYYKQRLYISFEDVDKEVKQSEANFRRELEYSFNPELGDDMEDFFSTLQSFRINHWQTLSLMKYNVDLMMLSTLYQLWEQQIRSVAYTELSEDIVIVDRSGKEKKFKDFCTTFLELEKLFLCSDWDLKTFEPWNTISELQLLQNVIKHGDGRSADKLRKLQPDYFSSIENTDLIDFYSSSLNEIVLNVSSDSIDRYCAAMIAFWNKIPQRVTFQFKDYKFPVAGQLNIKFDQSTQEYKHFVEHEELVLNSTIEIKFRKNWIKGTYRWSGRNNDLAELYDTGSQTSIYFGLDHLVRIL